MYEKVDICPSCQQTKFTNQDIIIDYANSQESFALSKCDNCELIFTNPRPSIDVIHKYYKSFNYQSHKSTVQSPFDLAYNIARSYSNARKKRIILRYHQAGSILDFGCGTGNFLNTFSSKKWKKIGLDTNLEALKIADSKFGIETYQDLKGIMDLPKFKVITCWHSIEHVHDLRYTIETLTNRLKSKGTLILAVPNYKSYDAVHYSNYWAGYDVPRHLYHFSPKSIAHLLKQFKMSLTNTFPLKLDAYYVSLLSEKYRKSNFPILKAIKTGYRSNRYASETNEYSSLIYVFTKK